MKAWLKHNTEPLDQVKLFMKATVSVRAEWIRGNPNLTSLQINMEYPRLLGTPGMVRYIWKMLTSTVCIFVLYTWLVWYYMQLVTELVSVWAPTRTHLLFWNGAQIILRFNQSHAAHRTAILSPPSEVCERIFSIQFMTNLNHFVEISTLLYTF